MKTITIKISSDGQFVELVPRPGASPCKAVIVVSDDVEVLVSKPVSAPVAARVASEPNPSASRLSPDNLDEILKRLRKLNPTTRPKAINSIKAMFAFGPPVSDDKVNQILEGLKKRGDLTFDNKGKLKVRAGRAEG
jgi:hypothetical protein